MPHIGGETLGQRRTLDQLQDQRTVASEVLDRVNGRDAGMTQRVKQSRFAFEPGHAVRVHRERPRCLSRAR